MAPSGFSFLSCVIRCPSTGFSSAKTPLLPHHSLIPSSCENPQGISLSPRFGVQPHTIYYTHTLHTIQPVGGCDGWACVVQKNLLVHPIRTSCCYIAAGLGGKFRWKNLLCVCVCNSFHERAHSIWTLTLKNKADNIFFYKANCR